MAESKKSMSDVAKPGASAPSSSSRPIIVEHRAAIRPDPMISEEDKPETKKPALAGSERKVIAPLTPAEADEKKEAEKPAEEPAKDIEPTETPEPAEEETASEGSAVVDAVAGQASDRKKEVSEEKKEKEHQEALRKLVEEKTYSLPIGEAKTTRNARWSMVVLILLVVLVGAYVAADAGLFTLPFSLPLNLIKN
jgi:hypothetical protein